MQFFRTITARLDLRGPRTLPLPIHVRSVGHYRLDLDYQHGSTGNEDFVQFFWCVEGRGELRSGYGPVPLGPGDAAWKLTGEINGYTTLTPGWDLWWFTFDGADADRFMRSYGYPRRLENAGPCPAELFGEIEAGLRIMTPYEERRLVSVAAAILALAGRREGAASPSDRISERFIELAHARYMEPGADVNSLADAMGMHRTTLTRHFQARMRMSPGEYLTRLRIQRAVSLLVAGSLPIAEVARRVGMPNAAHFSRAIKSAAGRTPQEIRRQI